jgi:hypothetical protein
MTFRTRRIVVALTEAAAAALSVLSQLVPSASHLVVLALPLTVLMLSSTGQLINRERPAAPSAALVFAVLTNPDWTSLDPPVAVPDVDYLAPQVGPVDWSEIALPVSVGLAAYGPPERHSSFRSAVQPGLFSLEVIDGGSHSAQRSRSAA